jgi:hypothetical protein
MGNTRSLILLSGSHAKRQGGRLFDPASRRIVQLLPNGREALIKTRNKLFGLLHGESGRLYNEDQKGGFRDVRACNRRLRMGPDFGGSISDDEIYLPAYQRYSGRFFDQLECDSPDFWNELPSDVLEVVFAEGLYGLLLWDELIQDYDCHLADYTRNGKQRSVSELWHKTVTLALRDLIEQSKTSRPIVLIYDLLPEEEYQRVFRWKSLQDLGVEIRHRVFRDTHGPDIVTDLARIVGKQLQRFRANEPGQFEPGEWYPVQSSPGQFRFEPEVVSEREHIRRSLLEFSPPSEARSTRDIRRSQPR